MSIYKTYICAIIAKDLRTIKSKMMVRKVFILLIFHSALYNIGSGQQELSSLDSIYLNAAEKFCANTTTCIESIWPGMKSSPICLFRVGGPAFLLNHPNPPAGFMKLSDSLSIGKQSNLDLFGSSQAEINNIWTATLDYESGKYLYPDEGISVLYHEMHHVYQRNCLPELEFDDVALMLTYPENPVNDAVKIYEHRLLYQMCFTPDEAEFNQLLNQFYACRKKRESLIKEYYRYEKSVESFEGPAFYCEYMYYKTFANVPAEIKRNYEEKYFFRLLTDPFFGRSDIRKRHIAAGMAMCCILNQRTEGWETGYYNSGLSLFDFFISKFKPLDGVVPELAELNLISRYYTRKEVEMHNAHLLEFRDQGGVKITLDFNSFPEYRGFDPMNAEAINDTSILHKTVLSLVKDQNKITVMNYPVITYIKDQLWHIDKMVVYLPNKEYLIELNDRIVIKYAGVYIEWDGVLEYEHENDIYWRCN